MQISEWLAEAWSDVVHGVRALRREPGITAFVVATLALGIGANAAMFGIVDRLLVSGPAHVHHARSPAFRRGGWAARRMGAICSA